MRPPTTTPAAHRPAPAGGRAAPSRFTGRRKWALRAALAVLGPVIFLSLAELGLRAAGYGHPTGFFVRLPGGDTWITNRCFGYRFADQVIAPEPLPAAFTAAKPAGTHRIFVLGDDAALGTPEPAYGFARVLDLLLRHRHPGVQFEFINCGVAGVNSHAVRAVAEDCA